VLVRFDHSNCFLIGFLIDQTTLSSSLLSLSLGFYPVSFVFRSCLLRFTLLNTRNILSFINYTIIFHSSVLSLSHSLDGKSNSIQVKRPYQDALNAQTALSYKFRSPLASLVVGARNSRNTCDSKASFVVVCVHALLPVKHVFCYFAGSCMIYVRFVNQRTLPRASPLVCLSRNRCFLTSESVRHRRQADSLVTLDSRLVLLPNEYSNGVRIAFDRFVLIRPF
jgi:hypothetical protein